MRLSVRARLEEVYLLVAEAAGSLGAIRARLKLPAEAETALLEVEELLGRVDGPACRICGCTMHMACEDGCAWIEADLCSACDPALDVDSAGPSRYFTVSDGPLARDPDNGRAGPSSQCPRVLEGGWLCVRAVGHEGPCVRAIDCSRSQLEAYVAEQGPIGNRVETRRG